MKSAGLLSLLLGITFYVQPVQSDGEELEFEYFQPQNDKDQENVQVALDHYKVEDEESEFVDDEISHLRDPEEFEGFKASLLDVFQKLTGSFKELNETKDVKHIPLPNWYCYYLEIGLLTGVAIYMLNYFLGKEKNQKIAAAWYSVHGKLLLANFTKVGEDERNHAESHLLTKHTEYFYTLWCTGRISCEGMRIELKLLKRQDLFSVIFRSIKSGKDRVNITVNMNEDDMDSVIFCLASKKTALRLSRDMADLNKYCSEKKRGDWFGLPPRLCLLIELNEVAHALLDYRVKTVVAKLAEFIDYIYISDQFSGERLYDYRITKYPDTRKNLFFGFHIPSSNQSDEKVMETIFPLLQLVFYLIDRLKKYRLSKDAKNKAEKNRQRVRVEFSKLTHAYRNEAAAARKEEKKRQVKEKILLEGDAEKQKKLEEREMKRILKKKAAKMRKYITL